ncbi:organic hydroperoxide resistance protein [Nonomuraea sp. NPDC050556]|uniref:organic hydroperoxide resistance protein n=1 Tax=Nonomuraea sp. NPDC050556 TaxID=3364369 RepID=UPI0037BB0772
MSKALYTAEARVTGGRANGHATTPDGQLDLTLRHPKELGGDGAGTNPEQLFAVGYAACFSSVLELVGRRQKLEAKDAVVDSKVDLVPVSGGRFELAVALDITLPSVEDPEKAAALVRAAHEVCPYSNATRGNIPVSLVVNGAQL